MLRDDPGSDAIPSSRTKNRNPIPAAVSPLDPCERVPPDLPYHPFRQPNAWGSGRGGKNGTADPGSPDFRRAGLLGKNEEHGGGIEASNETGSSPAAPPPADFDPGKRRGGNDPTGSQPPFHRRFPPPVLSRSHRFEYPDPARYPGSGRAGSPGEHSQYRICHLQQIDRIDAAGVSDRHAGILGSAGERTR